MSENRSNKNVHELLVPGDSAWELWRAIGNGQYQLASLTEHGPGSFTPEANRHLLALPAVSLWVLPAWLKGEPEHLQAMASLHLEKMGVRIPAHDRAMVVESLDELDGSHLVRILALKDQITPLASHKIIPQECRHSASCYPLPADSLVLWRELGKIVLAITAGPRLVYFTPLSSTSLDANAVAEINHLCLQLSFQRVISNLSGIVMWLEESDALVESLRHAVGLSVSVQDKPEPRAAGGTGRLMPQDLIEGRLAEDSKRKRRLMALAGGLVMAAVIAGFAFLIGKASQERDALLEKVAAITPKASKVEGQKAAWTEAAPAADPTASPMETLLRIMEPSASGEVTLVEYEWTPTSVVMRGRAPEISPALKYMQEIKDSEALMAYNWEPGTPQIGENGAAFEVKGTRP